MYFNSFVQTRIWSMGFYIEYIVWGDLVSKENASDIENSPSTIYAIKRKQTWIL